MTQDEPTRSREEVAGRLRSGFERLGEEIDKVAESLGRASAETAERYQPALERLRHTWDAAAGSLTGLERQAGAPWERLRQDIDRTYHQLASEVDILRSDLQAELAETWEEYRAAVGRQLEAWERRIEEFRVQASLARMDVRQEVQGLVARLESTYHQAQQQLQEWRGPADTAQEVVRRTLGDLVGEMRAAAADARKFQ